MEEDYYTFGGNYVFGPFKENQGVLENSIIGPFCQSKWYFDIFRDTDKMLLIRNQYVHSIPHLTIRLTQCHRRFFWNRPVGFEDGSALSEIHTSCNDTSVTRHDIQTGLGITSKTLVELTLISDVALSTNCFLLAQVELGRRWNRQNLSQSDQGPSRDIPTCRLNS